MSVLRQLNLLSQMRLDIPHLRSLESSIAADFDVMAGRVLTGSKPVVVRGFTLSNIVPGTPAGQIQMNVADAIMMNIAASESGTFFWVPNTRGAETLDAALNPKVTGGFTAAQVNYIGLDLLRSADTTTADLVQFLDADTLLESPKTVPLGRTLDYRIVISTTPFGAQPNIVPIAKVVTNANNQISTSGSDVTDCRPMLFRLASGGDFPDRYNSWGWAQGRNDYNTVNGLNIDKFQGGDKYIRSQKEWMDAIMTRLWEIGGGEQWYSPTADRNVRMTRNTNVFSNGDNFEVTGSFPEYLHWQGLGIMFENSNTTGVYFNTINDQLTSVPGLNDLVPGECIYVDVDRTSNAALTAKKATIQSLGTPLVPGSRIVLAWCISGIGSTPILTRDTPYPVGSTGSFPATTTALGIVKLSRAATTPAFPIVISDTGGTITPQTTGVAGLIIVANAGGGTAAGITSVGNTTGPGGLFTGGATGNGLTATAGVGGAYGIQATGTTDFAGVFGTGGASAPTTGQRFLAAGVYGVGNTAGAYGVVGISGTAGTIGTYSSLNLGEGVLGIGRANSAGVMGIGGGTAGSGVSGVASDGGNGAGGFFTGAGSGHGTISIGGATGHGLNATGGATSGSGVNGIGGAGGGRGGTFTGTTTFAGAHGIGGPTGGSGISGQGTASSAVGGSFIGGASAAGVTGTGGSTAGVGGAFTGTGGSAGATGQGQGAGAGLVGTGGATGAGVTGTGGATSGVGVIGQGVGASAGGTFTGGATGVGLTATGGSTGGNGATLTGTGGGQGAVISGQGAGAGATIQGGATGVGLIVSQSVSHVADVVQVTNAFTGSYGINAASTAPNGAAIRATYAGASTAWAIRGEADTATGYAAIVGQNTGTGAGLFGAGAGVTIAAASGTNGTGVLGIGSTSIAGSYGGYFAAGATNSPGVRAIGNGSGYGIDAQSAQGTAVRGRAVGTGGYGGAFESQFAVGLKTQGTDAAPSTTVAFEITGYQEFKSVTNPAGSTAFTNTLTAKNVVKAWFKGTTDGAGGFSSSSGFNMTFGSFSGNLATFTLSAGVTSGTACVVVTCRLTSGATVLANGQMTSATAMSVLTQGQVSGGTVTNFNAWATTSGAEINIIVMGEQ